MSRARRSSPTTCNSRLSLCRHARRGQEGPRDQKDPRPETKKEVPPLPHRRGALASRPVLGPRAGVSCASPACCQPAWCQTARPTLAQSLAPGTPVRQASIGGADGFTGANEFDVRTTPDGRTASAFAAPGVIRVAAATPAGPSVVHMVHSRCRRRARAAGPFFAMRGRADRSCLNFTPPASAAGQADHCSMPGVRWRSRRSLKRRGHCSSRHWCARWRCSWWLRGDGHGGCVRGRCCGTERSAPMAARALRVASAAVFDGTCGVL